MVSPAAFQDAEQAAEEPGLVLAGELVSHGARQRGDGQPAVCVKGWPWSTAEGWTQRVP